MIYVESINVNLTLMAPLSSNSCTNEDERDDYKTTSFNKAGLTYGYELLELSPCIPFIFSHHQTTIIKNVKNIPPK